jgi:serpin B
MVALLPAAHEGGCPAIAPSVLNQVVSRLAAAPTALAMPRVRLSSKADMAVLLGGLGMGSAFGAAADFSGLSPAAGALGVVEHATTLRVDEKGTVAAAATATGVGVAVAVRHHDVVFDRPYLLLVRDTVTGEPLFLARVADPSLG